MKKYNVSLSEAENFIARYCSNGGEIVASCEGSLGLGTIILQGHGLRSFVIHEVYLNEWSSGHVLINYYNKPVPEKWYKLCEENEVATA